MNRTLCSLATMVLLMGGCASTREAGPAVPCKDFSDVETWTVAVSDPVFFVGHGAILDQQGREVVATPKFVNDTQRFYLKTLYRQANDRTKADVQGKVGRLCRAEGMTPDESRLVNAALIAWLIDAVKPANASTLAANNRIVRGDSSPSPRIRELLNKEGLGR